MLQKKPSIDQTECGYQTFHICILHFLGQVDGFAVAAVKPADTDRLPVTVGQTFIWGNVLVNIQGGYDINTGMYSSTSREGMTSIQVCNINIEGGYDINTGMCSSTSREGMTSTQLCNINIQGGYDINTGMYSTHDIIYI